MLTIYHRALELYGEPREGALTAAREALLSAEGRLDYAGSACKGDLWLGALAQAIAEYMSLSGPWHEETGEYAGIGGYTIRANGE